LTLLHLCTVRPNLLAVGLGSRTILAHFLSLHTQLLFGCLDLRRVAGLARILKRLAILR
jgi:hypothetical protein